MLQKDVDELDAQRTNFAATAAVLMAQPEPVFLDFQKLLIERQRIRGPHRPGRGELALSMSENFSEMTGRGHRDFRLAIFEWAWREFRRSIEIRNSKIENSQSSIA
jgi:hypothetical protein